jgi:hypothetical protein
MAALTAWFRESAEIGSQYFFFVLKIKCMGILFHHHSSFQFSLVVATDVLQPVAIATTTTTSTVRLGFFWVWVRR